MNKLIPVGRTFFAVALIGLGIDHFVFRDFVTGRAPAWPESIPGRVVWAYLTGIVFVVIGIAVLADKMARSTAIFAGALIFLWALLRHIPVLATSSFLSGNWTGAGKALWLVGGCLAIAATFPKVKNDCNSSFMTLMNLNREFIVVGCVSLGWFMIQSGIQHFMFTEFVASLIPGWFPGKRRILDVLRRCGVDRQRNRLVHSANGSLGSTPLGINGVLVVLDCSHPPDVPHRKRWNCCLRGIGLLRHRLRHCRILVQTGRVFRP
jgi:uncharacterized membrane protein